MEAKYSDEIELMIDTLLFRHGNLPSSLFFWSLIERDKHRICI